MRCCSIIFLILLLVVSLPACSDQPSSRQADSSEVTATKSPEFDLGKLTNSAQAGNAADQLKLGEKYEKGDGVPKDATKAAEWYLKAAEQGNVEAQNNLGLIYENGEGVPEKNLTKAAEWYQKAAEQGNANAQWRLGKAVL